MSAIKKLVKHSSHYFGGRVAMMLLGFISYPILTRVFTVEQYGVMALTTQLMLLFSAIGKMGMQHSVQRFQKEQVESADAAARQRHFATSFYSSILLGAITAGTIFLVFRFAPGAWAPPMLRIAICVASPLILLRTVRSMVANFLQSEGRTVTFNAMEVSIRLLTILATVSLLLYWKKSVAWFFAVTLAVEALLFLIWLPRLLDKKFLSLRGFDRAYLWKSISFGFPLMWSELASLTLDSGDRFMIQYFSGSEAVGLYSAVYGVAQYVYDLIMFPLNMAMFPICMDLWVNKGEGALREFLGRSLRYFLMGAGLVVAVMTVTARDLTILLASKKFESAYTLLPLLIVGLIVATLHIFFKPGLLIHFRQGWVLTSTILAIVLNIGLNLIAIPRLGAMGAAITTLVSYIAWVALMAWKSLHELRFPMGGTIWIRVISACTIAGTVASQIQIEHVFVELIAKTSLSAGIYLGLMWALNHEFRELLGKAKSWGIALMQRADENETL